MLGGDPEQNAKTMRLILQGTEGPLLDFTVLNAAAALVVGGVVADLAEGVGRAREIIASGAATKALEDFVALSQQFGAGQE